ncbi:MAG: fimbria/pilus outer membrane usher protein, partial [Myxococcales bacterium]|nr:fimbria/pilus outer membrane usher protein [Myxococcales bacterium]
DNEYEGFLMLTHSFGGQTTGSASHSQTNDKFTESLQLQRSMTQGEDWGYRLDAQAGEIDRVNALGQAQLEFGRYEVSVGRVGDNNQAMVSASGGLVFIGGGLFATRPVHGSYALIQVPEAGGVRGYLNNQKMGDTDSDGDLLVPNLLAYHRNRLSVAPEDMPMNFDIGDTELTAVPPFRGGVIARFDAKAIHAVAGKVVVLRGEEKFVPQYGDLTVQGPRGEVTSPLGKDGEFYLEELELGQRYPARIEHEEVVCEFELNLEAAADASDGVVADIGEVRCKAEPTEAPPAPEETVEEPADKKAPAAAKKGKKEKKSGTKKAAAPKDPKP